MQKALQRAPHGNVFVLNWKYDLHHTRRSGSPTTHAHLVSSVSAVALRGIGPHVAPETVLLGVKVRVGIVAPFWHSLVAFATSLAAGIASVI
jgi:hypothetical protein